MKLTSLQLEHFRNYTKLDFAFPDEPILVLSGENAQGKTSFLEALYLLALTKSFRTSDTEFLKQFEKDYFRIVGTMQNGVDVTKLELCEIHEPSFKKVLKKNGTVLSAPKFIGNLKAVLFRPEDLQMLTGEPALRRKYLNTMLIQTIPGYMRQLQTYQKVLTQRNALLFQMKQGNATRSALEIWDSQLVDSGSQIIAARLELIDFLSSEMPEPYSMSYKSTIFSDETNESQLQTSFADALSDALARDARSAHTSVGPHRDDIQLQIGGKPLELTASRGELRSCLMALKQAEIAWMQSKTGTTPLILLDDIFSELDTQRKTNLFDLLPTDAQIVMTIAEGNPLPASPKLKSSAAVRQVHDGHIANT